MMMKSVLWSSLLVLAAVGIVGCKTFGDGITNREFDRQWVALEVGQITTTVETRFGAPREKNPSGENFPAHTQWIYSRPEVIGHRTEIDEVFRGDNGVNVPVVERVEVLGNVEFHLYFINGELTHWEHIVPSSRSF